MTAGDLKNRARMEGFLTDQQVAFYFRIGPGLEPLFGVPEILIRDCPECVGRLQTGLVFLIRGVFAIGNEAQKPLGLPACKLGRPRGAVRTDGDEALSTEYPVLEDVGRLVALAPNAKTPHCFAVVGVPNSLARLERLHRADRYARNGHLSPL